MSTIDIIVDLLKKQNKKQKDLTDYLGITKNAFTDWKSGRIKSYQKHLPRIAEFFNCSVDYLLGKEECKVNSGIVPDDITRMIYDEINDLRVDEKEAVLDFIRYTKSKRN